MTQKSKLGVSIGFLAAVAYFAALFSGYFALLLVVGYILIRENNDWLRHQAVKAVILTALVSVARFVINLLPDTLSVISNLVGIFGGFFHISFISNSSTFLVSVLVYCENLLFIFLAIMALKQKNIKLPLVDKMAEKFLGFIEPKAAPAPAYPVVPPDSASCSVAPTAANFEQNGSFFSTAQANPAAQANTPDGQSGNFGAGQSGGNGQ